MSRGRFLGVMEAILVTFLWSSSYVLIQIAVLSWLFLVERLTGMKLVAMVFFGVLTVQLRR